MNWRASGLRLNDKAQVSAGVLRVGARFAFDLRGAAAWRPEPVPATWTAESLRRGLAALRDASAGRWPRAGLGRFIDPDAGPFEAGSVCRTAQAPIGLLRDWLRAAFCGSGGGEGTLHGAWRLVGLGPGLTPSGDDFLGGAMIALHGLAAPEIARCLWAALRCSAVAAGNPISLAHLDAASRGGGGGAIHRALAAVIAGRPEAIRHALAEIDAIGHTSGWDTLAGIATAFDAWLASRPARAVAGGQPATQRSISRA